MLRPPPRSPLTDTLFPYTTRFRAIVANSSTSGTAVVEEIVAAGAERRVRMVDCPISGGPEAARKAALSVMISGTPADIERLRPLLDTFAGKITVAGEKPGAAQVLKLVNNQIGRAHV